MADAIIVNLLTICTLAAFQFCAVAWRVAGCDKLTSALIPWERVVWMVSGNSSTVKNTMALFSENDGGGWDVLSGGNCINFSSHYGNRCTKEGRVNSNEPHATWL